VQEAARGRRIIPLRGVDAPRFKNAVILSEASPRAQSKDLPAGGSQVRLSNPRADG